MPQESPQFLAALRDFRRARQRAVLEGIIARLTQQSAFLLDYDEIREQLHGEKPIPRGLREIPINAIVGSVGRYTDFTRSFLPRRKGNERRWAMVKAALPDVQHFPPITVYQVDQAYFVLDGNHRVSIAQQAGASHIPAYVTEIEAKVPLSPDMQPDELICQAKYADFLVETKLDETRPSADFSVTAPGQYRVLLNQITKHQEWMARDRGKSPTLPKAAVHWYDDIYIPVIKLIRRRGILRHFPGRTETDLYTWITQHRQELQEMLGWDVHSETAADDLITRYSPTPQQVVNRVKERIVEALTPEPLEAGPAPGWWRQVHEQENHLFRETLVPMSSRETGQRTLEQSLIVARLEGGRLHGLHVRPKGATNPFPAQLEDQFYTQCAAAGVSSDFSVVKGKVLAQIMQRARWSDLVVYTIAHAPHERPLARLSSNFNILIRQAVCPILVVPCAPAPLERALLAYDGSAKAKEALFVSAYLAGKWEIPLVVVTVTEGERAAVGILDDAQAYLAGRGVSTTSVAERGSIAEAIEKTAVAHQCDFIIMGGYGFKPLLEMILGSTVDRILRLRRWPVLICR
jgi:nucleotide-binding universal stress UspA family protein